MTLPGAYMRGRQSAGMLALMGVTETVAATAEQYVDIAVRLARDRAWRDTVAARMESARSALFDDRARTLARSR